jgi:hypothetical protein
MGKVKPRPRGQTAGNRAARSSKRSPAVPHATGKRSAVEQRWTEYWTRRQELEDAVARVRVAREALEQALAAEQSLRGAFDETKRALKDLLDVDPAEPPAEADESAVADELN